MKISLLKRMPWLYDDLRIIEPLTIADLDADLLDKYLHRVKEVKPRLAKFENEQIYNLTGMIKDNRVTLSALMIFHPNPQAIFPKFCIEATVVTGTQLGSLEHNDENIIKNKRIEGNILDMLEKTMAFIYQNMSVRTFINKDTLKRDDKTDYPEMALREAILKAKLKFLISDPSVIPADVITYIANNFDQNVRELEGAFFVM